MKKRIISLLLCVVMLMGLLPTSALAITINPDDAATVVYGFQSVDSGYTYHYNVYRDTKGSSDSSFYAELTSVTIDPTATGIELTIPGTFPYTPNNGSTQPIPLRVISGVLGTGNTALKSVSIPASVEIIGADVFKNNRNLEAVTFRESSKLRIIGDSAFYYCHALKSCVLPETVETIGSKAFYFTGLTSVTFGSALKTLGTEAFANCESLANLDMNKVTELEEIPEFCFAYHALTSLTIPKSVKTIGESAFNNIGGPGDLPSPLTILTLQEGLETIGEYAFYHNEKLTDTLTLPNSVRSIGKCAFGGCGYTDVEWPQNNGDFTVVNGFSECRSLTGAAIESLPLSVTTIGEEAFSDCIKLGSVTIPASVRTIEEKAFYNAGITSLTIAYGVQSIETNAFQNCTELLGTEITIPASVTTLASGAFSELFTLNAEGKVDVSKSLTVKVMNPNLVLAKETGDYQYFPADVTNYNNPSYTGDAFAGCVNLILYAPAGTSTAKAYKDKFNGVIIQAKKENINYGYSPRTVAFHELTVTDVPVSHTVTLPTVDGVTFTVKQDGKTLTPDSEGKFSALHGKGVVVTAHKEGYYDQKLVKLGADFTGDWSVVLGTWIPLPDSNKLLVNIKRDNLPLSSFDGLRLTLKNGNADVRFTESYPYLVPENGQGITADTELTLTVTPGASMQLSSGSATSTLQDGIFTVALKSWGKAEITAEGSSAAPCVVILFDAAGNAVSSGTTSGGVFTSDSLPAGTYTAVAYETNDYFGAVGSKAALSGLRLTSGEDYAEGSVTIADGGTAELTLAVPKLNTGNLTSVLDAGKCSLVFRSSRVVTGETFDMQVNYALKTGSAQKITFTLPAGAIIQSVYNEQGPLTADEANSVTVSNASGTLYVSLVCTGPGVKSLGASITTGGTTLPLGSGTVTVQNIFIDEANSYTSERVWEGNRVSVYTKPNAPVILTIPGAATVNETANAAGRATLTYSLPDGAAFGQSYILTVAANGGSDKTSVTYLPDSAELQQFGFRHYGYDITVIDHIHPENEKTYYTYYAFGDEASKYFSFSATIKADQKLKVTATVTMQDGSVRSVPMTQVEETGGVRKYAGELYLEGNTADHVFHADSIPVGFGISWEDSGKVQFDGEAIYLQAMQRASEQREARESILDSVNGKDIEVEPFFGYAYRTVGTQTYQDCLMTQSEYEKICAKLEELTGVDDTEKAAFKANVLDQIYSTVGDCVALAQAGDKLMDDTAEVLRQVMQLDQPLQQYQSWDDVLSDMRVSADKSSSSAQQLEGNGFTQVKSSWCKLGEKPNDGFTVAWPNGYDGGTQTPPSGEQYTGNATVSVSSLKKAEVQNWSDQVRAAGSHALGDAAKMLEERAARMAAVNGNVMDWLARQNTNTWDDFMNELGVRKEIAAREKLVDTELNKACMSKALGVGVGAYNMFSDADQLNENIVKTAESEAKASELDVLIQYYTTHVAPAGCLSALQDEKKAYELLNDLMNQKSNHLMLNVGVGAVSLAMEFTTVGVSSTAAMTYDAASGVAMYARDVLIAETQKRIEKLHAARVAACGGEGWKKAPLRTLTPILDPSGIVYEAVESNVLSGVKATIYEIAENGSETEWNAAAYGQRNRLTTGADGGYAWDVPPGLWQVKFTKEGYNQAQTEQLTVPPPRMNLKTAMVSAADPTVVSAAAYPDYVELVFSQYMRVTDTLTVPEGYTYEWVNKEKVNAESSTEYSKVLHLIPASKPAVGATVAVTLSGAYNYAGKELPAYSNDSLIVAVEPATLELNYETQIAVLVGETKAPRVTVQVLASNGRPIPGLKVTAAIADTAYATVTEVQSTTGEDGVAVFSVKGKLPGWTEATFSVAGSSLTRTIPVRVTIDTNQAAKPVATIGGKDYTASTNSITVPRGSALTLTCATEGAVIYYTTNDTCPCQALDRQTYTGPITVNEDAYFRIAAYKEGMEYSERLNLKVSVSDASSGGGSSAAPGYSAAVEQPENGSVTVTPQNAKKGDTVTLTPVSEPGYVLKSLSVTDSSGKPVEVTKTTDGKFTFVMPAGSVAIRAEFANVSEVFTDVPADSYYTEAVAWAVENGVTVGTNADGTLFSPNAPCTRAQIVTFLWRAAGSPEPKGPQSFNDVTAGSYYEKAVAWAAENGITGGTGDGKFSPDATCTRAQAVTFLYRAGSASAVSGGTVFTDVAPGAYYADAVAWAAENGITGGIGGGLFAPGSNCTRAQIVTFLYRSVK